MSEEKRADGSGFEVMIGGLLGGVVGGLAAYFEGSLEPFGVVLIGVAGSALGSVIPHLVRRSAPRNATWTVVSLSVVAAVAGLVFFRGGPPPGVTGFAGGCEPYTIWSQKRWDPIGTSVRAAPSVSAKKVGGFSPNEVITVDGWVRSRAAYPHNRPPFDSDIWFHVADNSGWVSFAGVRGEPTQYDPTGIDEYAGAVASAPDECRGTLRM